MLEPSLFFDTTTLDHPELFDENKPVWNALLGLKVYMAQASYQNLSHPAFKEGLPLPKTLVLHGGKLMDGEFLNIEYGDACKGKLLVYEGEKLLEGASVLMAGSVFMGKEFFIGRGTLIETGAMIKAPAIIGDNCEVRQGAYLRGHCLVGKRCVLGHTTEIKHSIFLNDAKAGHFAYLGDSILGNNTNLGAGTKFANLRFLPGNVQIRYNSERIDSGLRKFGAIFGDHTQTGCNSVTSPGTVFGKNCILMPNTTAPSGYHPNMTRI